MSLHDRPTLPMMLRPGRKPYELHRAMTQEIFRLKEREEDLTIVANKGAGEFVRQLAIEARDRLSERRELLIRTPRWGANKHK